MRVGGILDGHSGKRRAAALFDATAVRFDPTAGMASVGIVMRPVQDTTFFVPLVLAADSDGVAVFERGSIGEVDVMRDQKRATGREFDKEALMPRTLQIISQRLSDAAVDRDHEAGLARRDRALDAFGATV